MNKTNTKAPIPPSTSLIYRIIKKNPSEKSPWLTVVDSTHNSFIYDNPTILLITSKNISAAKKQKKYDMMMRKFDRQETVKKNAIIKATA